MCRCASTANIWPGAIRPDGCTKLPSGDGGALYVALGPLPRGAYDAPNRFDACCSVITETTHSAMPLVIAAEARPTDPAAPPPPPVNIAVKRTSGTPSHWANSDVSKPML